MLNNFDSSVYTKVMKMLSFFIYENDINSVGFLPWPFWIRLIQTEGRLKSRILLERN